MAQIDCDVLKLVKILTIDQIEIRSLVNETLKPEWQSHWEHRLSLSENVVLFHDKVPSWGTVSGNTHGWQKSSFVSPKVANEHNPYPVQRLSTRSLRVVLMLWRMWVAGKSRRR